MQKFNSLYRTKLKIAKWFFTVAVLFFVGKPFVGFTMERSASTNESSILVKSFTKRKHEYIENSSFDIQTIQKKLANPVNQLLVMFTGFLAFIFVAFAGDQEQETSDLFRRLKLSPNPAPRLWLSNSQLLI